MDSDNSVRTIVVVNRRLLAGSPTDHQHFHRFIATDTVAPVIALFESEVRLEVEIEDFNV
jgi:hypothetical protein